MGEAWPGGDALSPPDEQAIRAVIQRQLEAFLRGDAPAAFDCVSQTTRGRFPGAQAFLERVRRRLKPLTRPRRIAFDELIDVQGQPAQPLLLQAAEGDPLLVICVMREEPEGWRVEANLLWQLGPGEDDQGQPVLN